MKKILGLILCGAGCASVWVLLHLTSLSLWYLAVPVSVAIIIGAWNSASASSPEDRASLLSKIGIALVIVLTLGYRFAYLETVPSGIDSAETPLYTAMSADFLTKGFWYTPYIGYLHTLYGYIGAMGMAISSDWDWGFRFATAFCSALTVLTSFLAIRALSPDCPRAAWIGAGLMAASPWHVWISRFLMQKFLLTLCESITLLGLALTVTATRSSRRYWGATLAASGFVLGLHAYWGCYVLAPVWGIFLVYLILFHPSRARQCWAPLLTACVLGAALSVPVLMELLPQLGGSGYVKSKFDYGDTDYLRKVIRNLDFIFWGLSSAPSSHGAPFIPAPVTFLFMVGLARAIRRFRSSITSALIVINFTTFFAGIALTWAHDMYMTGLLFSVYCLAGQGVAWIGQTLVTTFGCGRPLFLGILPLVFVGQQAVTNYTEALLLPTHTSFGPYVDPGSHLRAEMRAMTQTHSVWVLKSGLGRGLWLMREQGFPDYAFVDTLNILNEDAPWFDLHKVEGTAGVEIFLRPRIPAWTVLDTTLTQLYPHRIVTPLTVPPPHNQVPDYKEPRALRVSIPLSDITQLKQPSITRIGDTVKTAGYLTISNDGMYSFCHQDGPRPELIVNGQSLDVPSCSDTSAQSSMVYLGTGVHPASVTGQRIASELTLIAKPQGKPDVPFADLLWGFTSPDAAQWALTHRGHSGKPTTFLYETRETLPRLPVNRFWQISGLSSRNPVLLFAEGMYAFDRQSNSFNKVFTFFDDPVVLGRPGVPLLVLQKPSKVFAVENTEMKLVFDATPTPIVDFDQQGDRLAILHADGRVVVVKNGVIETTVSMTQEEYVMSVVFSRDSVFVATQSGIYMRNIATGASDKIADHLPVNAGLSSDAEGNLYVWSPNKGELTKVFTNDGERLFSPSAGNTALFVDKDGTPVTGLLFPKFVGDEVTVVEEGTMRVFRRRAS